MSKLRIAMGAAGVGLLILLAGCATTEGSTTAWSPRTGFDLVADRAACLQETRDINMKSASGYSDARYGAAAAMAGRMDRSDNRGGGEARLQAALQDSCMRRKGWTQASAQ